MSEVEDRDWQRLDRWLWCARLANTRAACARMIESGAFRLNRQPVDKAHARVRPGDVLTIALGGPERGTVRVWQIRSLAGRRGPAPEAQGLYEDITLPNG